MISVTCNGCGKVYRVSEDKGGRVGKCSECGARIQVPSPEGESKEADFGAAIGKITAEREKSEGKVLGKWMGAETVSSEVFKAPGSWRLLWAVKALRVSSFSIYVRREGRMKTLALAVNERNNDGILNGVAEVDHAGEVYLQIKTTGCERWFVVAQEM